MRWFGWCCDASGCVGGGSQMLRKCWRSDGTNSLTIEHFVVHNDADRATTEVAREGLDRAGWSLLANTEFVAFWILEHDPPCSVAVAPAGLAVNTWIDELRAEAHHAVDLGIRVPCGKVDVHPVLARRRIIDSEEQDVTNTSMIGRSKRHKVVTLERDGIACDLRPEAAEDSRLLGVEGDVEDER